MSDISSIRQVFPLLTCTYLTSILQIEELVRSSCASKRIVLLLNKVGKLCFDLESTMIIGIIGIDYACDEK